MKRFDAICNKIESGFLGFFAGTIWCFIFYSLFRYIYPEIQLSIYYLVFVAAFIIVSIFFKRFIEYSGLGSLYALVGFVAVILHLDSIVPKIDWAKIAKELLVCLIIGGSAGIFTIMIDRYAL